jgi:hypothetical protein
MIIMHESQTQTLIKLNIPCEILIGNKENGINIKLAVGG